MGLYDLTAKTVLSELPQDLIEAALGAGYEVGEPLPADLTLKERRADHLRWIRKDGDEALLVIEVKAKAEPDLAEQLFGYFAQVLQKYGYQPVLPLAILLKAGDSVSLKQPYQVKALGFEACSFQFKVLRVHELSAKEVLEQGRLGLMPLLPLMRGADSALVREASLQIQRSELEDGIKTDMQVSLALLAAAELDFPDIMKLIPKEAYMKSSLYESILEEGRLEGEKKGLLEGEKKGRQEGRQEGRHEELRRSILKLVAKRWPDLVFQMEQKTSALDSPEQLEKLFDALLEAGTTEEAARLLE